MTYYIFEVDGPLNPYNFGKFLSYIDRKRVSYKLEGDMKMCIGSFEGRLNPSFIMSETDFEDHVRYSGFVDKQLCFLVVEQLGKVPGRHDYAYLEDNSMERERIKLGKLVTTDSPELHQSWTYRPDLGLYFTTEEETK